MAHHHIWYELDPPTIWNLWHAFSRWFVYGCRMCTATRVEDCEGNVVSTGYSVFLEFPDDSRR